MNSHAVYLPWPSKALSPNSRGHWSKLAKAKKQYRTECMWQCAEDKLGRIDAYGLEVKITFFPPDNRHRDLDNMLASLKSGLDGVADVCGVDDSRWTITLSKGSPVTKQGMVKVELFWTERETKAA